MPLVTDKPTAPPAEIPTQPQITTPQSRGVTVDTKDVPQESLLTHIPGSSMITDYFSQVLFLDSPVRGQSVNLIPEYQQYRRVKNMEFKVTTPFTDSQENTTNQLVRTGASNIYPFLKPNIGDMFLADIGDGREGIFKITGVERKTLYKMTIHSVEYEMVNYSSDENPWLSDLISKVVQTLVFVKDYMEYGQNPLLTEEEFVTHGKLTDAMESLVPVWFSEFTSREYSTLLVPGQEIPTYDHFLTMAASSFFNTDEAPQLRYIRKQNVDDDQLMEAEQLWKVLIKRDPTMLLTCAQRAGLTSTRLFTKNPMLEGIYHSGINRIVYLKDAVIPLNYLHKTSMKPILDDVIVQVPPHPRAGSLMPHPVPPLIHDVMVDDYYVFSKAFYDKAEQGQSRLELCANDYIYSKSPNNPVLLELARTYPMWGALERFYYGPILLLLMRASLRSR